MATSWSRSAVLPARSSFCSSSMRWAWSLPKFRCNCVTIRNRPRPRWASAATYGGCCRFWCTGGCVVSIRPEVAQARRYDAGPENQRLVDERGGRVSNSAGTSPTKEKDRGGMMTAINVTSHSRAWLGIAVALAAAAGYAVANTSANLAYQGGSNPLTVAATRFLVPTLALIVWLRLSGVSLVLPKRDTLIAVLLGFLTALYTWALLRSFGALPFALAVLIFYLFPLIAAVIVAAFGWEKFAWRTVAAIVLALVGLALALDVRGGNLNAGGITLALLAAV